LDGPWSAERKIPSPVSSSGAEESQPFFDGHDLYFRRETTVFRARYQGGAMGEKSAWSKPEKVLDGEHPARQAGEVLGVGEPTIATLDRQRELNFDVGRVASRTGSTPPAAPAAAASIELPIGAMQGIENSVSATVQRGIEGAAGGDALVWQYDVKPGSGALLLMPGPALPEDAATVTLTARARDATTLGIMVSEKGGARYAVQVAWPGGKWQSRTFKWSEFAFQAHGNADASGRLEPGNVDALLLIDASGYQGQSGRRLLEVDALTVGTGP
jgi:hypothetical protein